MHIPWLSLIAVTAVIPQNGNALVFGFSFNSSFLLFRPVHHDGCTGRLSSVPVCQ